MMNFKMVMKIKMESIEQGVLLTVFVRYDVT